MTVTAITDAEIKRTEAEVTRLERYEATMARYFQTIARHRKNAYDAHIEAGFKPEQALELVRDVEKV